MVSLSLTSPLPQTVVSSTSLKAGNAKGGTRGKGAWNIARTRGKTRVKTKT